MQWALPKLNTCTMCYCYEAAATRLARENCCVLKLKGSRKHAFAYVVCIASCLLVVINQLRLTPAFIECTSCLTCSVTRESVCCGVHGVRMITFFPRLNLFWDDTHVTDCTIRAQVSLFLILYRQGNVRDSMILHINHVVESATNVNHIFIQPWEGGFPTPCDKS